MFCLYFCSNNHHFHGNLSFVVAVFDVGYRFLYWDYPIHDDHCIGDWISKMRSLGTVISVDIHQMLCIRSKNILIIKRKY